jgi:hypothetical protein
LGEELQGALIFGLFFAVKKARVVSVPVTTKLIKASTPRTIPTKDVASVVEVSGVIRIKRRELLPVPLRVTVLLIDPISQHDSFLLLSIRARNQAQAKEENGERRMPIGACRHGYAVDSNEQ